MPEEITKPETTTTTPPANDQNAKTYTEEYVKALREEAKDHRVSRKAVEAKLKKLIGLSDDEDIDDAKITAYQTAQQTQLTAALQKANDKLILAEIKNLEGYDTKLLSRLLDKSKLTISDDGTVTGLKEEALAVEFPQIKKAAQNGNGANPPVPGTKTDQEAYEEAMREAIKNPKNDALKRKVFLLGEKIRQK